MRIQLCRFRPPSQLQPHNHRKNSGQIIVVFAVTLLALIFFTGLAIDAGSLYVTYGQMRRAIDSAAVAAANEYKSEGPGVVTPPKSRMDKAAMELMKLHNLDEATMDLRVYVCDQDGDRLRDDPVTMPADFYQQCPDTTLDVDGNPIESARKLVWIEATQTAPLYFLSLLGFQSVPLRAHAIAEAAPIDLVIVIDTSESMANATAGYSTPYDPSGCNSTNTCQPLLDAKNAANDLIDTLYDGYDHVAVVSYDVNAPSALDVIMHISLEDAKDAVDALQAHDDPPYTKLWSGWTGSGAVNIGGIDTIGLKMNPVYPEDRDSDGGDAETAACVPDPERMAAGSPCDDQLVFDAYNWDDSDTVYTANDDTLARQWLLDHGCDLVNAPGDCEPLWTYFSPNSTCTGCGVRVGAEVLRNNGRPNSVWVMVVLSDGLVNLSDTHDTNDTIPVDFTNGYCNGGIGSFMWSNDCLDTRKDEDLTPRYCLDDPSTTCPPGSIAPVDSANPTSTEISNYSVYDYTLDMIDFAALQRSDNAQELSRPGSDISIYSIGLGDAGNTPFGASGPIAEYLLRYMAAVGDDGDRETDPCVNGLGVHEPAQTSCGQYYYAPAGSALRAIFNEISTRIYSRLTK